MKRNLFLLTPIILLLSWACSGKRIAAGNSRPSDLEGRWELSTIDGASASEVYPLKIPFMVFDLPQQRVSGNTGCNSFSGPLTAHNNSIDFNQPFILTKMFCEGGGESRFLGTLERVQTFRVIDANSLEFYSGDTVLMRFVKRQ